MELNLDSVEQARRWADDWLARLGPSPVVIEVVQFEDEHREWVMHDYGRLVAQFEAHYTALVQLIDQVNFIDRSAWPQHRAVQYVLMSYNLKPLWSAVDRLTKGFYGAGAVFRTACGFQDAAYYMACWASKRIGEIHPIAVCRRFVLYHPSM